MRLAQSVIVASSDTSASARVIYNIINIYISATDTQTSSSHCDAAATEI